MTDETHSKLRDDATTALQRAQQVARDRSELFGTPFLAKQDHGGGKYSRQQPDSSLVQETPESVDEPDST